MSPFSPGLASDDYVSRCDCHSLFCGFGAALSPHISGFSEVPYLAFIVPGLILLQATNNAFQNPSSSLIISKYHGTIVDLLTAPLSALEKHSDTFWWNYSRNDGFFCYLGSSSTFCSRTLSRSSISLVAHAISRQWCVHPFRNHRWYLGNTFDQISGFTTFIITPMGFLEEFLFS